MLSSLHHIASLYHSFEHLRHTYFSAHDEMATSAFNRAIETVEFLRLKLPPHLSKPRVAIVCGSGLGGLAETVNRGREGDVVETWEYKDVPNFPISTGMSSIGDELILDTRGFEWEHCLLILFPVAGHEGKLIFGTMGSEQVPVVLLVGRAQSVVTHLDSCGKQVLILFFIAVSTKVTLWRPSHSPLESASFSTSRR